LAYHLERLLSKEEILTAYMNHVYLGHGASGMDVASQFYFGKDLGQLNFVEELILVSLPSAPERFSPLKNRDTLERKLDVIFARMAAAHVADVNRETFEKQKREVFASLNRSPKDSVFASRLNNAPFLAEFIRLKIKEILGDRYEYSAGLRVETTVDFRLQQAAAEQSKKFIQSIASSHKPVRVTEKQASEKENLANQIADEYSAMGLGGVLLGLPESKRTLPLLETASIGLDPATGEVLCMQGGINFSSGNQFNRAIAMRRQTGSAIKPIIYSAGIESGKITVATPLDDTPIFSRKTPRKSTDKGYWLPENMSGVYEGNVPARKALIESKNVPAIRVARMTGMDRIAEQFQKFFFPDPSVFEKRYRSDDTVAIGSLEMTPLEMASAFSAFGNNGVIKRPYVIKSIKDRDGKELYADRDDFDLHVPPERKVIPGDVAEVMSSMLFQSGAGGKASDGGFYGRLLGKTGTTNDSKDTWFVGVTPGLSM
ncbi:MAG: transglycosylase domain-containing protein, partial [Spirochaetia bacterium]|nr:transglycosylase domain-containing protein [Spirochaetia bacterium]